MQIQNFIWNGQAVGCSKQCLKKKVEKIGLGAFKKQTE